MDDEQFLFNLKYQPSIKLLRSDNASLIIAFLQQTFKKNHRMTISFPELVEKLESYLEELNEHNPGKYPRLARDYLKEWSDDDHRFIRLYHPANSDVPLCELTANTEKAINWIDSLKPTEFIGTESRFLQIFSLLEDISQNTIIDSGERLKQLEEQKSRIQSEIDRISSGGIIERYTDTQVKERFLQANDIAQELLRDFAQIEDIFRTMARTIHVEQLKEDTTKGKIIEKVLIADQGLKESDQGRSFYTFWDFLISPRKKDELRQLIESAFILPEIQPFAQENPILRHIIHYLIDAGHKVMQSNSQLADRLRRLLDERNIAEGRRVLELTTEIKQLAALCIEKPPSDAWWIEIEGDPIIHMPMERPLWEPADIPVFTIEPSIADNDLSDDGLSELYNQYYVNEADLRRNIEILLMNRQNILLSEIITEYPIQKGLSELIAYFNIASDEQDLHTIDGDQTETIEINTTQNSMIITIPKIIFRGS